MSAVLRLEGVHKSFGEVEVLRGIDLSVAEHEVVALIGASGSGKSTLLRTINLLERVDDGQVWLRGSDISDPRVKADAVRARIGVVFQQFNLFPHLTVLDNVTLASRQVLGISRAVAEKRGEELLARIGFVFQHLNLFPHLSVLDNVTLASRAVLRVPRAAAEAIGLELLDRIGLADKARAFPDQLSGGQQQRAAIVRAVATNPALLLLDEITSALDPELVGGVLELVRELGAEGATIVMATHEMAFAREVASRVVFLDQGVIVEQGTPAQVFGAPQQDRTREFLSRFTS